MTCAVSHQLDVVLYNLATAVAAQGDAVAAIRHFQAVLEADPQAKATLVRIDARLNMVRLYWAMEDIVSAEQALEAANREALLLQSEVALASVLVTRADGALRAGALTAARRFLVEAGPRLANNDNWELTRNWRFLDILLRIGARQLQPAEVEIEQLEEAALARKDQLAFQQSQHARMFLAMAQLDMAAAYSGFLKSQAGLPPATATTPSMASSLAAAVDARWLPWVTLALGALLGWTISRIQFSKPLANKASD